ncbi:hyaluronidase-5-like [Mixophyes fleayi]|uniref:hyaluronidase-5-like n=1 Tax=Mixophyes fleayi TaxID=3061075 RepID=UPI003F4DA104
MEGKLNFQISVLIKAWFLLALLTSSCYAIKHRAPAGVHSPFVSVWNAPTELCMKRFKVPIDVHFFDTVGSTMATTTGQNITIFYSNRLGYYPYINPTSGVSYNGGIPQMTNMEQHFKKAKEDILHYLPSAAQRGLAVIDWEEWRPIWIRNWASKEIYKKQSIDFALQKDLTLDPHKAYSVARIEFETSARRLMLNTLRLGKQLRPNYLWGFYLFPNCHNYDYKKSPHNYTGRCADIEEERNDQLRWLWKESTALFPNIYLDWELRSSRLAAIFTRHSIREAKRLSELSKTGLSLPIYVYTRPVFSDHPEEYLTEVDLVNTIGESAALGVTGFVVWGGVNLTRNMDTCMNLNTFIINILNPYIINVSLSAKLCSTVLCQNNGVCTRKAWNTSTYLHLNQRNIAIKQYKGTYKVKGNPSSEDLKYYSEHFKCHCYAGQKCKEFPDIQEFVPKKVCITQNICINLKQEHTSEMSQYWWDIPIRWPQKGEGWIGKWVEF